MQVRRLLAVEDPLPTFAANVRRLREERGLSQEALALSADMDAAEVRRIEAGRRDPGVRIVTRLAAGLATTPAELLAGILEPAP
jgi:transcriptional regulator with XRE-family HTH domain